MVKGLAHVGNFIIAIALIVVSIYPVAWLIVVSLQSDSSAYQSPTNWIFVPQFGTYGKLFADPSFLASLANSVQLAVIATALCVLFGAMGGYALSRYKVPGATGLTFMFALSRLVPTFAIVVPTFYIYRQLNLLDTMAGLVLALVAFQVPLSALIMYRIFGGIPQSLDEAARIDGAGFLRILWQVILPVARPGLAASAVVTFVLIWNEFLFVLVLAGNQVVTIPVTIAGFQTDKQVLWSSIAATSVISLIPILLLIAFAQRHLLSGLGMGAVRE
ncbi:carbohydrate ABC transporter permease [Lacisediminihabitans profunda]|uniref:Carbohydrate ABC transporter permease n=1 Tax=Lacisediminihabitans profunda TaxID=2594790 RepID=A0A5C8UN26_9MICO|nr:carbohydrate ABC transporter permease [Lacisediminihabitans profunda]TXN29786.1 carbohydrate ABC transporter permease [Lacisediminihabitans profunda]